MEDAELEAAASDLHDLQQELGRLLFAQLLLLGDVVEEVLEMRKYSTRNGFNSSTRVLSRHTVTDSGFSMMITKKSASSKKSYIFTTPGTCCTRCNS